MRRAHRGGGGEGRREGERYVGGVCVCVSVCVVVVCVCGGGWSYSQITEDVLCLIGLEADLDAVQRVPDLACMQLKLGVGRTGGGEGSVAAHGYCRVNKIKQTTGVLDLATHHGGERGDAGHRTSPMCGHVSGLLCNAHRGGRRGGGGV